MVEVAAGPPIKPGDGVVDAMLSPGSLKWWACESGWYSGALEWSAEKAFIVDSEDDKLSTFDEAVSGA